MFSPTPPTTLTSTLLLTILLLTPHPTHADCRPGIDDCTSKPLALKEAYSSASTYQCHYAAWSQAQFHTTPSDCSTAAFAACTAFATSPQREVWQNATYGNCWVGTYLPSKVADPLPSTDTLAYCTDQVFKPMISSCIGMPSRVDSAFLNIVVPPYGNTDYSWFVDYEKPAFVVTTSGLVSAGQVPGMSAAPGTIGPYVGTDPRGRPAGCSQRGGFCPSSVGSPMKLSRERRGGKDW